MQLYEIGQSVAKRRAELDLTQAQLAKLSGLSRFTVNQLETGKVKDLGINKLIPLLSVLGIELTAKPRPDQKGLFKASVSANVSYKGKLTETQLARSRRARFRQATSHRFPSFLTKYLYQSSSKLSKRRPDHLALRQRRSGRTSRRGLKTCIRTGE